MRDFVVGMGRALADHPEDIAVSELQGKRTIVLEMRCHPDDMGRLIGKSGRTINAMRTLLETMAAKQKQKSVLEVVEYAGTDGSSNN